MHLYVTLLPLTLLGLTTIIAALPNPSPNSNVRLTISVPVRNPSFSPLLSIHFPGVVSVLASHPSPLRTHLFKIKHQHSFPSN